MVITAVSKGAVACIWLDLALASTLLAWAARRITFLSLHVDSLVLLRAVPRHDANVGLLVLLFVEAERVDAAAYSLLSARVEVLIFIASVVRVAGSVEGLRDIIVAEEHVVSMIVDKVALLLSELHLRDETRNTQLLQNVEDVELLVKTSARL